MALRWNLKFNDFTIFVPGGRFNRMLMKILFVVSEVEDLVKTWRLADVAKSLPFGLKWS